jgi:uracil-DNA glycosylase family 4
MSTYVPGFGNRDRPKLAIVGEAPGAEEIRRGEPFVGASGSLLNSVLGRAGIDRNTCYLTNVVKLRPTSTSNDFGAFYKDKQRRQPTDLLVQSTRDLISELKEVRPNLILALGGEALKALTGHWQISQYRGSVLQSPAGKVLASYHPAAIFRVYEYLPVFRFDIRKAAKECQTPFYNPPKTNFTLQPSFEVAVEYIRALRKARRIGFDTETSGSFIRCLGLSGAYGEAICIPFLCSPTTRGLVGASVSIGAEIFGAPTSPDLYQYWSEPEERVILEEINALFQDDNVEKVAQNAPFDLQVMEDNFGIWTHRLVQDTMLANHCCYVELPKGLDFLASIYTDYAYWSAYDPGSDLSTWTYNCFDTTATLEISDKLDAEMKDLGQAEFYRHQYHDQLFAITRAEVKGIKVDQVEMARRRVLVQASVEEKKAKLQRIAVDAGWTPRNPKNPDFNPSSWMQLGDLLYGALKLPVQTKRNPETREYQQTTDKNALINLARLKPEHAPLFNLLLDYSKDETLFGFLNRGVGDDGRIRTHYNLGGTDTRRLASAEPLFFVGTNLQNLPRGDFRSMFVADEGWSLIKADLSQAEFRIVVWLARITRIINLYLEHGSSFDVHKWNAANNIFLCPLDQVTKEMRTTAKNGVYGGNYRMAAKKAAVVYKMPLNEAELILARYRQNVPEVETVFWRETEEMVRGQGRIISPLGSLRIFNGRRDDDETYRAAYSYRAQELVSAIINRAFALADEIMDAIVCYPLLQVHDEIVFHCRDDCVSRYVPLIRRLMEYPIKMPGVDVPLCIPTEVNVGKDWYNQKEIK